MTGAGPADPLSALKNERVRLEERLRLYEAEVSSAPGNSSTETPEQIRDQISQVNRMIAEHEEGR